MKLNVKSTFEMLTVGFGESAMSRIQVQLWYKRFKEDRKDYDIETKAFAMIEEIKEKWKQKLLALPKCFEDWEKCWHKCIISKAGYFK